MPKKVVLIEPVSQGFQFDYLPQGLLSVGATLRDAGFDVSIHRSLPIPQSDILGISATTTQYIDALNIARQSVAGMVVLGGSHVTTATADAMNCSMFSYGVVGDGENALLALCSGENAREIPGVVYHKRDVLIFNPNEEFTYKARDETPPLPAYDLLVDGVGEHVNLWRNREWSWYYGWVKKNRPKYHEWFSSEVRLLRSLGVKSVTVTDENFGCWHKNIGTTVSSLNTLDWWACRSGVRNFLDRRLDKKLFGSRCRQIEINMTTANPRLLGEFYDYTVDDIDKVAGLCEEIGIEVSFCATLGLPGETVDSMIDTWNWLRGKKARLETMIPLPGTVYYEEPDKFGQFGYEVVDDPHRVVDDRLFYRMGTIAPGDFMQIRSEMAKEICG